jgi:hypothetical protein
MLMHSRLKAAQHAGGEYHAQANCRLYRDALDQSASHPLAVGLRKHGREAERTVIVSPKAPATRTYDANRVQPRCARNWWPGGR